MVWVPQYMNNASSEGSQRTFRLEFIVYDPGTRNTKRKVTSSPVMLVEFQGNPLNMAE